MSEIATGGVDYSLVVTVVDVATHIIECHDCNQPRDKLHSCEQTENYIQLMTAVVKRLTEVIEEKKCLKKVQQQQCTVCQPESLVDLMNDMDI